MKAKAKPGNLQTPNRRKWSCDWQTPGWWEELGSASAMWCKKPERWDLPARPPGLSWSLLAAKPDGACEPVDLEKQEKPESLVSTTEKCHCASQVFNEYLGHDFTNAIMSKFKPFNKWNLNKPVLIVAVGFSPLYSFGHKHPKNSPISCNFSHTLSTCGWSVVWSNTPYSYVIHPRCPGIRGLLAHGGCQSPPFPTASNSRAALITFIPLGLFSSK